MELIMIELPHEILLVVDILNMRKTESIISYFCTNMEPGPMSPPLVCSISFAPGEAHSFLFYF